MLCVADGSDMMGSLRNPAGWNNLYSLRPTVEWMEEKTANEDGNKEDDIDLPYPISTVGPMARCPEDVAKFLETILPDNGLANFQATDVIDQNTEDLNSFVRKCKIRWLHDWDGAFPCEDGLLEQCKGALSTFESGGANVEYKSEAPISNNILWQAWMNIRSYKIFNSIRERIGCDADDVVPTLEARGVKAEAIWECEEARSRRPEQLQAALHFVQRWSRTAEDFFEIYDFLALPASEVYPFDANVDWPKEIAGKNMHTYHQWMNVMVPVTLLGCPCVTLPTGHNIGVSCSILPTLSSHLVVFYVKFHVPDHRNPFFTS